MDFCVVEFKNNTMLSVPNSWVLPNKRYILYPNKNHAKLIKLRACPMDTWTKHKVKVHLENESYDNCEKHLKNLLSEMGSAISESDGTLSEQPTDESNETLWRQVTELRGITQEVLENQKLLLKDILLIKSRQTEIITLLQNLNLTPDVTFQPSSLYKLPIQSVEDLKSINDILSSMEEKRKLIKFLLPVGGKNEQDCTYRIMERMFAPQLSIQMNWVGKNEKKYGIVNSPNVVTSIVHAVTVSKKCENKNVEDFIKNFLRSATDRYGLRKKPTGSKNNNTQLNYDEEVLESIICDEEGNE